MMSKREETQNYIDALLEGLLHASYDINPITNRPVDSEYLIKIQKIVIKDLEVLSDIANRLNKSFAEYSEHI